MHVAMVSDAHGFLAQGFDYADQLLYRYRPVKGRVIRVVMEMHEIGGSRRSHIHQSSVMYSPVYRQLNGLPLLPTAGTERFQGMRQVPGKLRFYMDHKPGMGMLEFKLH